MKARDAVLKIKAKIDEDTKAAAEVMFGMAIVIGVQALCVIVLLVKG